MTDGQTRLAAPIALRCDAGCSVVRDAVLDIDEGGRIAYCGPRTQAPHSRAPIRELPGLLMPGLVNVHCHTPMIVLRGLGGDLPLLRWLHEVMWPAEAQLSAADVHAGMLLGCVEMLRAGVTTSVEMYLHAESVVEAVLAAGSRAVVTPGVIAGSGWARLGSWEQMRDGISRWIDADGLRFGPGDRIELGYGPHAAYTLPTHAMATVAAEARLRGALLHTHLAETRGEDDRQRAEFGSVVAMFDQLGVLGGRTLAAHAVHVSPADVEVLAAAGVAVAHCPGSNAKLAAGIAPFGAFRAAGLRIGLGTDGPASSDDLDLWPQARLAAQLARLSSGDAAAFTAVDALLMATSGGAGAIGRDDLGALEPGRWADLVHLDTDDPAFIGLDDDAQLVSNLVWAGGSRLVRDVWVAGEQVVDGGETTRVERARAQAGARAVAARVRPHQ